MAYTVAGVPVPWDALGIGSGWAIVCLFVILFFRGKIVPRSTIEDMKNMYEKELANREHDRDEWRAAHRISEQGRVEEREHNSVLIHDIAIPLKGFLEGFRRTASISRTGADE